MSLSVLVTQRRGQPVQGPSKAAGMLSYGHDHVGEGRKSSTHRKFSSTHRKFST